MQLFLQHAVNALSLGGVYALIAVGFALIFNVLKFSNWSHGGVIMVSSYIGYFSAKALNLPLIPALVVTMIGGGILAVIIEKVAFRTIRVKNGPLIYFFVTSITMSLLLMNLVLAVIGYNFYNFPPLLSTEAVFIAGINLPTLNVFMLVTSVIALVILTYVLRRTRIGIAIRAAASDMQAASLMGVEIDTLVSITFFISGVLAGASGMFLGMSYTAYPQMAEVMAKGFVAAVLGGLGSLAGAVIGALLLGVIETMVTVYSNSSLVPIVSLVILILLLIFRPRGIAGIIVPDKV